MSEKNSQIVTVDKDMADEAGAVVYWSLSGDTSMDELEKVWNAANLDTKLLPDTPTPERALRRALNEQRQQRRLVRPHKGGWALVDETADDKLEYKQLLHASINKIGHLEITDTLLEAQELEDNITVAFEHHQEQLSQSDISVWLVVMAAKCQAVALRERGGIYFIPHASIGYWRTMTEVLGDVSEHTCFEIPALKTDQAVDAILAAVMREAQDAVDDIGREMGARELQKRALRSREDKCTAMLAKLDSYEALLGKSLDTMATKVEDLKISIGAALLEQMEEL